MLKLIRNLLRPRVEPWVLLDELLHTRQYDINNPAPEVREINLN
jgi:hypothetical protein